MVSKKNKVNNIDNIIDNVDYSKLDKMSATKIKAIYLIVNEIIESIIVSAEIFLQIADETTLVSAKSRFFKMNIEESFENDVI